MDGQARTPYYRYQLAKNKRLPLLRRALGIHEIVVPSHISYLTFHISHLTIKYRIVENALIARISAYKLKKNRCAIVVGSTIYLWGISKRDFQTDEKYLKHELQHIFQYHELGVVRFIVLYLIESARVGYYNNKFEVEARAAEEGDLMAEYELVG